jgi:flagellar protein FlbD
VPRYVGRLPYQALMRNGSNADKADGASMIRLTRLSRLPLVLNADLIEHIDVTPDTVITLTTGQILRVRESAEEVVDRIVEFRRRVFAPDAAVGGLHDSQSLDLPEEAAGGQA